MLRLSGSMNALMSRISVLWSFPIVLSLHFTSGVHSLRSRSLVQDTMESERHWGVMTAGQLARIFFLYRILVRDPGKCCIRAFLNGPEQEIA